MTSVADPHASVTCPACGRGVPGDSRTCPSCDKSTLVDVRVLQPVTDHRKAYEAARRLPELHPTATFQQVKKALETKGAVVLSDVPPGPAVDVLAYLEQHGIAAYAAPPAGATASSEPRSPVALAGVAAVLVAAGLAFWLLRSGAGRDEATRPTSVPTGSESPTPSTDGGVFDREAAANSVVEVSCDGGNRGLGFFTRPNTVVTLRSLCAPGSVTIRRHDGVTADVVLNLTTQLRDSVVVSLEVPDSIAGTPFLTAEPSSLPDGAVVFAASGARGEWAWTETRVASRRLDYKGWSYVQIEDEAGQDAGGGPLLDRGGSVVGVLGAAPDRRELAAYLQRPLPTRLSEEEKAALEDVRAATGKMLLGYAAVTPGDTLGLVVVELAEESPAPRAVEAELWRHGVVVCRPNGQIVLWESYTLDTLRPWIEEPIYNLIQSQEPELRLWVGVVILVMGDGCAPSPTYITAEVRLLEATPGYDRAVIQRGELPGS